MVNDLETSFFQDFTWIGNAGFSSTAGELRFEYSGGDTHIFGDTNGDGTADIALVLSGEIALTVGDFIL
jgi:hypothetical protein